MKRIIYAFAIVVAAAVLTLSCNKDDSASIAPPRDYGVQYANEKQDIEKFLKKYYIVNPGADVIDVRFDSIPAGGSQVSIWDQTVYPLQKKEVIFSGITYDVYYLKLNEGTGDAPNRGDNILSAYRGTLIDKAQTQFDYLPYPQNISSLHDAILGWQEIIPLFKEGEYIAGSPGEPAQFQNFGAGIMFLPSALAYYQRSVSNAPAYSTMVFRFKLYRVEDGDVDGDGISNKNEMGGFDDPAKYDSDGDGTPNYRDTDDDNDGTLTRDEITDSDDELFDFEDIPSCDPLNPTVGTKRHLDPACDGFQ